MSAQLVQLVCLALVVWCVSTSVAKAKIFEPLHNFIFPSWLWYEDYDILKSNGSINWRYALRELISCQRCLAHYVAILALVLFPTRVLQFPLTFVEFVANWFLVVAVNDVIARKLEKKTTTLRRRQNP